MTTGLIFGFAAIGFCWSCDALARFLVTITEKYS